MRKDDVFQEQVQEQGKLEKQGTKEKTNELKKKKPRDFTSWIVSESSGQVEKLKCIWEYPHNIDEIY